MEESGLTLLSEYPLTTKDKPKLQCSCGHIITGRDFYEVRRLNGKLCPYCHGASTRGSKFTTEQVREFVEKRGMQLLSDYTGAMDTMTVKCSEDDCPTWDTTWSNLKQRRSEDVIFPCPVCSDHGTSMAEREIQKIISDMGYDIQSNIRNIPNPNRTNMGMDYEMDIWIPSEQKYIDYRGVYWHSLPTVAKIDLYKDQWCRDNNIHQLVVFEKDWMKDKNIVISQVKTFLGH